MKRCNDSIWVLRHSTNKLTKTWNNDGTISNYDDPKLFIGSEITVSSINELSDVLSQMENDPNAAIIRGKYKGYEHSKQVEPDDSKKGRVLRRKSVHDDVKHHWLLVDVDSYKPINFEPLVDTVGAINEFILACLPGCFHGMSYHWQLSSSAGHPSKPVGILKVHIWFWLATPYTSAQLKAWAIAVDFKGDKALLDTIQVHYTAAPVFTHGVANPVKVRSGFVDGEFGDAVSLTIPDEILSTVGDGSAPASRSQKLQAAQESDPIAAMLHDKGMVKSKRPDGGLNIQCPRHEHHTGESGVSSSIYYAAYTGGHKYGAFVCLHEHCRGIAQSEFLEALGYDDLADVFSALGDLSGMSIDELFSDLALREEHVKQMAEAEFLIPDLIVRGHVAAYVSPANGGKTAIFVHISEKLSAMGMRVLYINVDGSPGDLKRHHAHAEAHGYTVIAPDACEGKAVDDVVIKLKAIAGGKQRCDEYVFIFDTLKKFVDVIQKKDAKDFYNLTRNLSVKGATICLLGHTNKHPGVDGQLVYEGTGDLRNDVDELIYLVSNLNEQTNQLEITTRPDKVRAEFSPVSYVIDRDTRAVREAERVIKIMAAEDRELVDLISEAINAAKSSQKDILEFVREKSIAGDKKIRNTLIHHSKGENSIFGFKRTGRGKDLSYFVRDPFGDEGAL